MKKIIIKDKGGGTSIDWGYTFDSTGEILPTSLNSISNNVSYHYDSEKKKYTRLFHYGMFRSKYYFVAKLKSIIHNLIK